VSNSGHLVLAYIIFLLFSLFGRNTWLLLLYDCDRQVMCLFRISKKPVSKDTLGRLPNIQRGSVKTYNDNIIIVSYILISDKSYSLKSVVFEFLGLSLLVKEMTRRAKTERRHCSVMANISIRFRTVNNVILYFPTKSSCSHTYLQDCFVFYNDKKTSSSLLLLFHCRRLVMSQADRLL